MNIPLKKNWKKKEEEQKEKEEKAKQSIINVKT